MTSKTLLSFILAAAFVTVSCKNDLEPQESVSEVETEVTSEENAPAVIDEQIISAPSQQQAPSVVTTPQSNNTGVALNPAHGQPGHRCEIAVGAPLNSTPNAQTPAKPAPVMTSSQLQNPAASSTPSILNPTSGGTTLAKGTPNPAHGQPGHKCEIAVGQPLP